MTYSYVFSTGIVDKYRAISVSTILLLYRTCYTVWIDWLNEIWTRTGGWEFDRSRGSGTSSPSHWQQVEEQVPKPVGWMMCFLLMTFVPLSMRMHSLYEFCYRTYIYIQQECRSNRWSYAPSHSIGLFFVECAVSGLNATFCFLCFTNRVLLYDK